MSDSTRRTFLRTSSLTGLGFGLANLGSPLCARGVLLSAAALPSAWRRRRGARAQAVIHLHLGGGMSHLDTFDPKPEAPVEVRGPFGTVKSKLQGEPLSDVLRRTAEIADKITVIRSMTHGEADHDRGTHSMMTGFQPSPALTYPSLGAVVAHELGVRNDLPPYVCVPQVGSPFQGTGYLSAAYAPFSVGDSPAARRFRVRDLDAPKDIDESRRARRKQLLHDLDAGFGEYGAGDALAASEAFYRQAYALIESPEARAAFDLGAEPDSMKERYGRNALGMGSLLARRLVQSGARYVVVNLGGFDHHVQIARNLQSRMNEVDQAFAALVADLDAQGLLDQTLVLLTTEFGRTPRINNDAGRDHWPRVFSVVMAGGGIARGCVHGASNAAGAEPERDPVRPADLAATVYSLLGIDPGKKLLAPGDRPIDLVREGAVLREVLG
ncbi:MAG TPA: DUF1501 domain-containing protein [Planctomycetota bacterium]|nr:DUF1501 domain-containing protein [Planctomycetota bacterium]